jgi:hypothetical protein
MGTVSIPGVKQPGSGADHTPPSSAQVTERVELYLYSPSAPSRPVIYLYTVKATAVLFQLDNCNFMYINCTKTLKTGSVGCLLSTEKIGPAKT